MSADAQARSRYFEVYERWKRDPEGFWAEAAREIDWIEQPKKHLRPNPRRLRALVHGRRHQYRL